MGEEAARNPTAGEDSSGPMGEKDPAASVGLVKYVGENFVGSLMASHLSIPDMAAAAAA